MEVAIRFVKEWVSAVFFKEARPFVVKREINWTMIKKAGAFGLVTAVVTVLLLPAPESALSGFQERVDAADPKRGVMDPSGDTLAQLQQGQVNIATVPRSLDYLYSGGAAGNDSSSGAKNRSASMILSPSGVNAKDVLPPGARLSVSLDQKVVVANQAMPIIATIEQEAVHENGIAIPAGSKLFGELSFDASSERASVSFRSIRLPDGRERQLSGVAVGNDGQTGVPGDVRSDGLKNTVGQTITRFIGAYAEGSISRGQLGASEGGSENGLKNAIAETARDRTEAWAEDMKKEKKWIEVDRGTEFIVVLNQPFAFRDPGATYGQ